MSSLKCETPITWIDEAAENENLPVVLMEQLVKDLRA
jgi:tRNA isopentenyl-2-thiomethyl-A-37 hydroxylase MiaE